MSDLDKKLDEVLDYMGSSYYPGHEYPDNYEPQNEELRKEAISKIIQAFNNDGWLDTKQLGGLKSVNIATPTGERVDFMTGQEWYDKFEKEFDRNIVYNHDPKLQDAFVRALSYAQEWAKKASGIE